MEQGNLFGYMRVGMLLLVPNRVLLTIVERQAISSAAHREDGRCSAAIFHACDHSATNGISARSVDGLCLRGCSWNGSRDG